MKNKFFDSSVPNFCQHCVHGRTSEYTDEIFCLKRGVTNKTDSCRHYQYDPLKRAPQKGGPSKNYQPEDFEL